MPDFQKANLSVIGVDSGQSVADEVNDLLIRACKDLQQPGVKGKASITMRLDMGMDDDGMTVRILPDVKYNKPKKKRKATTAFFSERQGLETQEGLQESLPLDNVTPIGTGK